MVIITVREFREKQKKYFDLAELEHVVIKRGKKLVSLVVSDKLPNPSPSEDKWFDKPDNLKHVLQGIQEAKEGATKKYTIEQIRALLK